MLRPLAAAALVAVVAVPAVAQESEPTTSPAPGDADAAHPDLREAVAVAAVEDGRLPLDLETDESCPVEAVELTFEAVPVDEFEVGGYVEPLIEPTEAEADRATGIARCAQDSPAIAGFDAFLDDDGWTVHFVSPLVEQDEHADHADDDTQDDGAKRVESLATTEDLDTSDTLAAEGLLDGSSAITSSSSASSSAAPPVPSWPSGMPSSAEALSGSDPQDTCDPDEEPGALALADLLTRTYGTTRYGISRDCSVGGRSEHKEGRAVDWMLNSYDSGERAIGDTFTSWVLGDDPWGNDHAGMRRMGIMYMIWNRESIYSWAVEDGWRDYTGSSPHTDHVHFSMTWPGARCQTSFWEATDCTGDVGRGGGGGGGDDTVAGQAIDQVGATHSGIDADFDGDGHGDVLWYGPGSDYDTIWYGRDSAFDVSARLEVNGTYYPIAGDFDGDGRDDIVWYGPGTAPDYRWNGTRTRGRFDTSSRVEVNGDYMPLVGDFNGNGVDDIFWYGPGSMPDYIWFGYPTGFRPGPSVNVKGTYRPAVADFSGNGRDDILWYGPGGGYDEVWLGRGDYRFQRAAPVDIRLDGRPVTGDFDGDGNDDVFIYGPGSRADAWFRGADNGTLRGAISEPIAGSSYRPFAGDFDDDGRHDIFWYGPNGAADWIYYGRSGGFAPASTTVRGDYVPVSGD
nr:VCBS repeat-containing protein [Salsipaludibacter albus]